MRFNYIQILRFLAATGVLLYHSHYYVGELLWKTPVSRAFDYRFAWGVELFFAISGFVVSHSLSQTTPGRFLAMRLVRIYPIFWLAAAAVTAARLALGDHPLTVRLFLALTLMPVGGADYPLGGVEWSLVYEVFFYVLLTVVALVRARNAREWAMVLWILAIGATAYFGPIRATSFLPTFATIAFSAFNLPFIAGVLAYSWFRRASRLPVLALLCTVPAALFAADRAAATEIQLLFQAVGFTALVLLAAELSRRNDPAATNPLVKLGDWSYAIYLVHVPVIKAVLVVSPLGPEHAGLVYVAVVVAGLVVGSAYGMVDTALYRRNKALLRRFWQRSGPVPAAGG